MVDPGRSRPRRDVYEVVAAACFGMVWELSAGVFVHLGGVSWRRWNHGVPVEAVRDPLLMGFSGISPSGDLTGSALVWVV